MAERLKHSTVIRSVFGFFRKPDPLSSENTDEQLFRRVAREFVLLFIVLLFFEDILDVLLDILHLVIELFEDFIEILLEHLLQTTHHQSEMIIVNAALIGGAFVLYRLIRALPRMLRRMRRNARAAWLKYKKRQYAGWRSLSAIQKIKLSAAYSVGFAIVLFWLTL